jgi:hypothetical protein
MFLVRGQSERTHSVILLVFVLRSGIQLSFSHVSPSLKIRSMQKFRHTAHSVPRKSKERPNRTKRSKRGIGFGIVGIGSSTPCISLTKVRSSGRPSTGEWLGEERGRGVGAGGVIRHFSWIRGGFALETLMTGPIAASTFYLLLFLYGEHT